MVNHWQRVMLPDYAFCVTLDGLGGHPGLMNVLRRDVLQHWQVAPAGEKRSLELIKMERKSNSCPNKI